MEKCKVAIIGGGPAGLAFATRLQSRGINDVVVFERETEVGGVPRHCGHFGFGWESHRRLMTGPAYATRLCKDASSIRVEPSTSVLSVSQDNVLQVHQPNQGLRNVKAGHIVFATGARETTRAARFMGGQRLNGVMNTGQLQQHVYLKNHAPFRRPIIIGGEWVSFSALMTCHHLGIRPAAILVEESSIDAPWFFKLGAKLRYGVPVITAAADVIIQGTSSVQSVSYLKASVVHRIACDGVIVSGKLIGEDALFSDGKLALTHNVSFTGNVKGPIKTAGRCVAEAYAHADQLAKALQ